jgi:hypothetical protein
MLGYKNDQGKFYIRPKVGKLGNLVAAFRWRSTKRQCGLRAGHSVEGSVGHVERVPREADDHPDSVHDQRRSLGPVLHGRACSSRTSSKRKPLQFQMKGADDIEFKTLKAMTEARYNIGFGHWSTGVLTTFT